MGPPTGPPFGQPPGFPPGSPPPGAPWGYGYEQQPVAAPRFSALAVAAFLCALLGWWVLGLGSLAGIVLGIVSLRQIKQSSGWLKGRGLAIAGIVMGAGFVFLFSLSVVTSHL